MLPQILRYLILLTLISLSNTRHALGINCRGSSQCSKVFHTVPFSNLIAGFNALIHNGSQKHLPGGPLNSQLVFYEGQHIACSQNAHWAQGSICMFMQGNVPGFGVDGYTIGLRINDLDKHGCKFCGSVPLSGDNEAAEMGWLTVNYVLDKGCNGLCTGVNQSSSGSGEETDGVQIDSRRLSELHLA